MTDDDAPAGWVPDVLGDGYDQLTLPLGTDDEGEVVATLVRRRRAPTNPDAGFDVLYVHGWSDYFFQTELADFWTARGARFFALDLRKYGRSLRPGQTPGFVRDLATYDEDVAAALEVIAAGVAPGGSRELVLMGHSTGGLTLSLWLARHPGRAVGVVLNSPWLEFQTGPTGRTLLEPVIEARALLRPTAPLPNVDLGFYTRAVSSRYDGEWDYDLAWRPEHGFRTTGAWLAAVFRGHAAVAKGLGIEVPVLVLLSTRSTLAPVWSTEMLHTDGAIDVDGVAKRSTDLGRHVTVVRIEGALHDVVLSEPAVRAVAYEEMAAWAAAHLPAPVAPVTEQPETVPDDAESPWQGMRRIARRVEGRVLRRR